MDATEPEPSLRSRCERIVFGRKVWSIYGSLVIHVLTILALVPWSAVPSMPKRPMVIDLQLSTRMTWGMLAAC